MNARGNPYNNIQDIQLPLHNFLTKAVVDEVSKTRILQVLKNGQLGYLQFRNERYKDKTKKITATISKSKLPSFKLTDNVAGICKSVSVTVSNKDIACAQKSQGITVCWICKRRFDDRSVFDNHVIYSRLHAETIRNRVLLKLV